MKKDNLVDVNLGLPLKRGNNMRRKYAFVCVFCLCCFLSNVVFGGTIGVFFDETAEDNCSDSLGLFDCFVLLEDITDIVGVAGWAFALRGSEGIFLIPGDYPVDVLNLEAFPSFYVGCATPIPTSPCLTLLSFSIYATQPGGIFIEWVDNTTSVCYLGAESNNMIALAHRYGSTDEFALSVGGIECPQDNSNMGGVVSVTNMSFDKLRSLYR